ncbi:MAG: DNA/RNA non-specific endonuclease [Elusimicrobia bacterium]|nr:DNA/RNA non-specific endonuclease [Elusimicrobiota bacterium]
MRLAPRLLAGALLFLRFGPAQAAEQPFLPEPQRQLVKEHTPFGLPSTGELLFRRGYVAGHNNWLKIPNWVAYHLPREKITGDAERAKTFTADPELKPFQRSEPDDYTRKRIRPRPHGPGRGHEDRRW